MDDCSRFILTWELKSDTAVGSLIDVLKKAVDLTGMTDVPVEDQTVLLSDNGPSFSLVWRVLENIGYKAHHNFTLPPSEKW